MFRTIVALLVASCSAADASHSIKRTQMRASSERQYAAELIYGAVMLQV
jgi:hypothetical protein